MLLTSRRPKAPLSRVAKTQSETAREPAPGAAKFTWKADLVIQRGEMVAEAPGKLPMCGGGSCTVLPASERGSRGREAGRTVQRGAERDKFRGSGYLHPKATVRCARSGAAGSKGGWRREDELDGRQSSAHAVTSLPRRGGGKHSRFARRGSLVMRHTHPAEAASEGRCGDTSPPRKGLGSSRAQASFSGEGDGRKLPARGRGWDCGGHEVREGGFRRSREERTKSESAAALWWRIPTG